MNRKIKFYDFALQGIPIRIWRIGSNGLIIPSKAHSIEGLGAPGTFRLFQKKIRPAPYSSPARGLLIFKKVKRRRRIGKNSSFLEKCNIAHFWGPLCPGFTYKRYWLNSEKIKLHSPSKLGRTEISSNFLYICPGFMDVSKCEFFFIRPLGTWII